MNPYVEAARKYWDRKSRRKEQWSWGGSTESKADITPEQDEALITQDISNVEKVYQRKLAEQQADFEQSKEDQRQQIETDARQKVEARSFSDKLTDLFDANSPWDVQKRMERGEPASYQEQQAQKQKDRPQSFRDQKDKELSGVFSDLPVDQTQVAGTKLPAQQQKEAVEKLANEVKSGKAMNPDGLPGLIATYASAFRIDPAQAFENIFEGNRIVRTNNGTIVVERMDVGDSQKVKRDRGGDSTELKLDHTIPLQLGGTNDLDNLVLVPTDEWARYTPAENTIGKMLRQDKVDKDQAQRMISDFKRGLLNQEDLDLQSSGKGDAYENAKTRLRAIQMSELQQVRQAYDAGQISDGEMYAATQEITGLSKLYESGSILPNEKRSGLGQFFESAGGAATGLLAGIPGNLASIAGAGIEAFTPFDAQGKALQNFGKTSDEAKGMLEQATVARRPGESSVLTNLGAGAGSLAVSLGTAGLTSSANLPATLFGVSAGGEQTQSALAEGKGPAQALATGVVGGLAEGGLEKVGIDKLLGASGGTIKRALKGALTEGVQETSQSLAQSGIESTYTEVDLKKAIAQALTEGVYGGILGGGAGVSLSIASDLENKGLDRDTAIKVGKSIQDKFANVLNKGEQEVTTDLDIPSAGQREKPTKPELNKNWFHGSDSLNEGRSDTFFSADESVAGDYGKPKKASPEELPRNPLIVTDKSSLAEIIGYKGDPFVQPKGMKEADKFDAQAKKYAQSKGHDSIYYESGSLESPELHKFSPKEPIKPPTAEEIIKAGQQAPTEIKKPRQVSDGVVEYDSLYHGTPTTGLQELTPEASKRTAFGANPVVSATDNALLAESFTRGELGDKPRGEVLQVKGPLKVIDTTTDSGKKIWESLDKSPQKAIEAGYDGIQHTNYERLKIESFYKDIDPEQVKDAKEVQIFKPVGVESKTPPSTKGAVPDVDAELEKSDLPELAKIEDKEGYAKSLGFTDSTENYLMDNWAEKSTPNQFYHVGTEEIMNFDKSKSRYDPTIRGGGISQINGLYLGRDPDALYNFYGMVLKDDQGVRPVTSSFKIKAKWLDLSKKADEDTFIKEVAKKYNVKPGRTKEFGDALEQEVKARGYDGVRYFDPYATGEEFVLVNEPRTRQRLLEERDSAKGNQATQSEKETTETKPKTKITTKSTIGTPKLAKRVKSDTIKKKIAYGFDKQFRNLPEYDKVDMKEQRSKATEFALNNPQEALEVALGNANPPGNLLANSVFIAVKNKALAENDYETLRRLANESEVTTRATQMGQEIKALDESDPNSPVKAMRGIKEAREERLKRSQKGRRIERAKQSEKKKVKSTMSKSTPELAKVESFIESLVC